MTAQTVRRYYCGVPCRVGSLRGQTRRIRYALRRPLRGRLDEIPVYTIDDNGRAAPLAPLSLVQPQGTLLPLQGNCLAGPD